MSRRGDIRGRKFSSQDIVVIDQADIDRATAEALVTAGVMAVVNAAPSITGRYPNLGPEILVNSGVILVDEVGPEIFSRIKDGSKLRLDGASVHHGEDLVATGVEQTPDSIADLLIEAKSGMAAQLEAFAANSIEYMKRERALLLDGVGIPEISTDLEGRHVLIVAASASTKDELKALRKYIGDFDPILVGVEAGADALIEAGHKPKLIVGNPDAIGAKALSSGAEVVIPADMDGHAPGLERLQDLGLGAVTFPATGTAEDLALLLADASDAELLVTVGLETTLTDLLDRGRGNAASTFLVRMRVANKLVAAPTVASLYRARISWWVVSMLLVFAVAALVAAILFADVSGTYIDLVKQWWNSFVTWIKGLF